MIQHFSKEGTFSSRLSFPCNCCILMQFNHQPITAIDLNFLHGVADTALLLLPSYCKLCGMLLLLVLQVLQVVQIEHCPGGEPALHCSLSSSQLICLATGLARQLEGGKCSEQSFVQYSAAQLHHSAHRARCRKQGSWIGWSDGQPVCWLVLAPLSCSLSDQQCWSTA